MYISYINDELESYQSIKRELEYLNIITEIDINNLDYKNNNLALKLYDTISRPFTLLCLSQLHIFRQ